MRTRWMPIVGLCAALLGLGAPPAAAAPLLDGAASHTGIDAGAPDGEKADGAADSAEKPALVGDKRIADIAVLGSDHKPLDVEGAWLHDGTLAVVDPGLSVTCTVDEELNEKMRRIKLRVDNVEVEVQEPEHPQEPASNRYVFDLDSKACKADMVDLTKITIVATDGSGKEVASAPLSELLLFKDTSITALRFVDPYDEKGRPLATVLLDGKPMALQPRMTEYTTAASVEVGLGVTDPLFEALRDSGWFGRHPIAYMLDGSEQALDPAALARKRRDPKYQYKTGPLATWDAEGRHTVSLAYPGVIVAAEDGAPVSLDATASASVLIDRTNPSALSMTLKGGYDADSEVAQVPGKDGQAAYNVLFGGKRTLVLNLADEPASEGIEASGVAGYTLALKRHKKIDASDGAATETITEQDVPMADDGTVEIVLDDAGTYVLGELALTVRDRAGNVSDQISLADIAQNATFDRISVDEAGAPLPNTGFGIEVGPKGGSASDRYYQGDEVQVTLWGGGWQFELYRWTPAFKRSVQATYISWKGEQVLAEKGNQPTFTWNEKSERYEAVLTLPCDADGGVSDGMYKISFRGNGLRESKSAEFMVDTTAPVVTDAVIEAAPDLARDVAVLDGMGRLAVGGPRILRLRVQDLQPRFEGDAPASVDGKNEDNTAGLDERAMSAYVDRLLDLNGLRAPAAVRSLNVDERGWIEIPLQDEGVYKLGELQLTLPDNAGSGRADRVLASEVARWGIDGILVDTDETLPHVSLNVTDAAATPASKDEHFHRGEVYVTARIEDRWFAAHRALPTVDGLTSVNTLQRPGQASPAPLPALKLEGFANLPGSYLWGATYELPRVHEVPGTLPVEGEYDLMLAYEALSGTVCPASPASFGIDYTSPTFGALTLSVGEPCQWGWVFAPESERIGLAVQDNLSGIEPASAVLSVAGTAEPTLTYEPGPSDVAGAFNMELVGDAQRLLFAGTHVGVEDRAGNPADSGSFAARAGVDLPEDAVGVCIDASAPALSIGYDNNDVANGIYYKTPRTATVTLVEPSFDLLQAFDPHREIVTVERDGSAIKVHAEDFANPSGDGATWVTTVACDLDADWALAASFEDMTGRLASVSRDAFVVDTTAPRIMVEFDNNYIANGMYFKAPRTASITVDERNFDPAQASVVAWAKDAAGNAVGAPAATAWREVEPRAAWGASIGFAGELHYGFTVQATDLAGNVAEAFEEPEFVIDLTAPALSIGGVEHHAAYADAVRPTIAYADVNFDPLFATYELTGAAQGDVYLPAAEEELPGSKKVSYEDFEHVLKNDDVYTLTARVDDLAGNAAEQSVTFSVNRFGSTYYFANAKSDVAGKFLKVPQGVDIVEVNVSGLDTSRTHVELVHDSRTRALAAGTDYELLDGTDGAWSATTYRLGQPLFEKDGFYRILLTSHDRAGNLSQNTMEGKDANREHAFEVGFAVDTTAPVAGLAGIGSRGVYLDPHKQVLVDAHDNVELARVALSVDGHEVQTWDAAAIAQGAPTHMLPADAEPHTYELAVTDRAGNTTVAHYDDVVVTGDWLSFILNTPRLLFGTVGGAILAGGALAGIGWVLWRRAKRARELRERLNS